MNRKQAIQALAIAFTLIALVGCQSGNQGSTEETPSSAAPATSSSSSSSRRQGLQRRSEAPQAPRAVTETLTAPAGTTLPVRLSSGINTGSASSGSTFQGSLAEPLVVNGVTVATRGSLVSGRITNVVSSGRLKRPAELSLVLTSVTPEGSQQIPISTHTWSMKGKYHKKRDIVAIGGGAGLGAAIGAIAGGGKGAAIGSAVGAGAGTAGAMATGKKEIDLPPETVLNFRLSAPASFTVQRPG